MKTILKKVSRSFYLSLRILPKKTRTPLALAYLLARSADTITDTPVLPVQEKERFLSLLKNEINGAWHEQKDWDHFFAQIISHQNFTDEQKLLQELPNILKLFSETDEKEKKLIRDVVLHLIGGMEKDLIRFAHATKQNPVALETEADLETYCFDAAGIVGPFWTQMLKLTFPLKIISENEVDQWAIAYGKGLQMTNVIKDLACDLNMGRCYIPLEILKQFNLTPTNLKDPQNKPALDRLIENLIQRALGHLKYAAKYMEIIPRKHATTRLATLLPCMIGLETLRFLKEDPNLLDPTLPHKISRKTLKRVVITSCFLTFSHKLIQNSLK
ncbi:MAG: hypothetical protein A2048_10160 [Deltaproteobacteria bacterium GWA2_45_12]|nr:MAG: hypothetical protein A2048_10160 [Deltaproteobacteria bacterium GWA2_45_12]